MSKYQHCARHVALISLGFTMAASAQISTINSVVYTPRQFNDVPGATVTVLSNYPSLISFEEQNVSKPTGFANRDSWHFSNNGVSPFLFGNSDAFTITMDVTLTGDPISPRKEAGFVFSNPEQGVIAGTSIGGYLQIVNSPTNPTNSGTAAFQNIKIGPPDQDFDGV